MALGIGLPLVGLLLRLRSKVLGSPYKVVDMRARAQLSAKAARAAHKRDPGDVRGVVLHQMGFSRGNDPMRYRKVTAHFIVLPDGGIYQLHGFDENIPASNGFNRMTVSVEFAGNFPSRSRSTDPSHFWNPDKMGMNQLTVPQALAGRYLLAWLHDRGVKFVVSHTQSNDGKGNDPGPDVWGAVAMHGIMQHQMSSDGVALRFPGKTGGPGSGLPQGTPGGAGLVVPQRWWDAGPTWERMLAVA